MTSLQLPRLAEYRDMLLEFGFEGIDDPAGFADDQYLIGLHLREPFQLLRSRPLYLNEIHGLSFSQAESGSTGRSAT